MGCGATHLIHPAILFYTALTIVLAMALHAAIPAAKATSVAGRTSNTGRTVAVAAEVTTIPAVVHTEMLSARYTTEVVAMSVVVSGSANAVPGMGATIGGIEVWTTEVEIVAVRVAGIDTEVPVACVPVERTIEVGGCDESIPLPVEEDITQVEIATLPVGSEHIVTPGNTHQIVKVDLVGGLVLLVCQIQLIGHLVGQEQSLVAGLLVTHCIC